MSEQQPLRGSVGGQPPSQFGQPQFVAPPSYGRQSSLSSQPWQPGPAQAGPSQLGPDGFGQPQPAGQPPNPPNGKTNRPLYRRPWFIVVAVLLGLGLMAQLVGGEDESRSSSGATMAASQAAAQPTAAEPDPVESQAPAEEPAPAPEPEPEPAEEEPEASRLQTGIDRVHGTFEPLYLDGYGSQVIELPGEHGIVTATANGSGNFIVNVLDENNEATGDLLVNTIGAYQGTTFFGRGWGTATFLEVVADGPWTIAIEPVSYAQEIALPGEGVGDAVYLYGGGSGAWTFTHDGQSNFVVYEYGDAIMPLLINEIGQYSGQVPIRRGPAVIVVIADGWWSVTP